MFDELGQLLFGLELGFVLWLAADWWRDRRRVRRGIPAPRCARPDCGEPVDFLGLCTEHVMEANGWHDEDILRRARARRARREQRSRDAERTDHRCPLEAEREWRRTHLHGRE